MRDVLRQARKELGSGGLRISVWMGRQYALRVPMFLRITVKKDMCISCGNCSTYWKMGIDVRAYAQANQSFTRASCVGCGLCQHVCPRGVLKLENKPVHFRAGEPIRVYAVDL